MTDLPCALQCLLAFLAFAALFGLPLAYWYWKAPPEDWPGQYG